MKKITSTFTMALLCLYATAQVATLDGRFNTHGHVIHALHAGDDHGDAIAVHSDGRVIVAAFNTDKWFTLLRYMQDGTLDPSFGTGGIVKVRNSDDDAIAFAIKILSDNTILATGYAWNRANSSYDMALVKLDESGAPITTFGPRGNGWVLTDIGSANDEAHSLAVQADGKIVVAGVGDMGANGNDFAVVRYSSNGILETGAGAFGGGTGIVVTPINAIDNALGVAIQPADQKIVVSGTSNDNTNTSNVAVVRYKTDGTLDGDFAAGGIADIDIANGGAGTKDIGNALIIQPDGKIVITGMSKPFGTSNFDVTTIRLTTDGALDGSFNPTGAIVGRTGSFSSPGIAIFNHGPGNTDEGTRTIALQSDGKIIVGGDTDGTPTFSFLLLRYNSNGTPDGSFDNDGAATYDITNTRDYGNAIALSNNRIYFTGTTGASGSKNVLLAAIENDGSPLPLVLSHFYAQKQTSKVVLQWVTASEEDLKQFVIERSNDGKTYKAIGQVAATGNSTTIKHYSFADQSPFMSNGNYYRLLMQDVDGNFKYSKILIIKFDGQLSTNLQVFPSPVKDLLQIQLPGGMNGNVSLLIMDMHGRVVKKGNQASDGSAVATTMDVSTLIKGVYILKAQVGNTSVISRFTKQ
jgi:uncharacterized delta-60 repeat protein